MGKSQLVAATRAKPPRRQSRHKGEAAAKTKPPQRQSRHEIDAFTRTMNPQEVEPLQSQEPQTGAYQRDASTRTIPPQDQFHHKKDTITKTIPQQWWRASMRYGKETRTTLETHSRVQLQQPR